VYLRGDVKLGESPGTGSALSKYLTSSTGSSLWWVLTRALRFVPACSLMDWASAGVRHL